MTRRALKHRNNESPTSGASNDKGSVSGNPKLFLLDVEGTVAPISLIYDQLFPYARAHFPQFLQQHIGDSGVRNDLELLAAENGEETDPTAPKFSSTEYWDEAIAYVNWLMDRDRKSTALKSLQGRIWRGG